MTSLTLTKLPTVLEFTANPSRQTAKNLTQQMLRAVEHLDGQAKKPLLETIGMLEARNQYHAERSILIQTYRQHLHDDDHTGFREAVRLMMNNAEKARLDGDIFGMMQDYRMAIRWALEGGWIKSAFEAADRMTAAGHGILPHAQTEYRMLAKAAGERDLSEKYAQYLALADEAERQLRVF